MTIDLFNHLSISVPTLSKTQITFYGTLGYWAFIIINALAIAEGISIIQNIKKWFNKRSKK